MRKLGLACDAGGGWCLLQTPAASKPTSVGGPEECGASKSSLRSASAAHPLSVGFSSVLSHGAYQHLIQGSVNASSGIVKVELHTPTGTTDLTLANGYFLGQLPPSDSVHADGASVVGYDAAGNEVAHAEVSPHA